MINEHKTLLPPSSGEAIRILTTRQHLTPRLKQTSCRQGSTNDGHTPTFHSTAAHAPRASIASLSLASATDASASIHRLKRPSSEAKTSTHLRNGACVAISGRRRVHPAVPQHLPDEEKTRGIAESKLRPRGLFEPLGHRLSVKDLFILEPHQRRLVSITRPQECFRRIRVSMTACCPYRKTEVTTMPAVFSVGGEATTHTAPLIVPT